MSDDQPDIGDSGFGKQLRNMRKGAKKRLKLLGSSFRSRPASPATTPSHPSTSQAVGSQSASPAPDGLPTESVANRPQSGIDTSGSPSLTKADVIAEAGVPTQPDVPIELNTLGQPEGVTPASQPHDFNSPNIPSTSNEPSEQETSSMNIPSQPTPSRYERVKDQAGVAWSFTQLLLKKAPIAIDTNPVKITMQDNMDATERRIAALSDLMNMVDEAMRNWHGGSAEETRAIKAFEVYVGVASLYMHLKEEDKQNIADIFERVNEARENMILATGLRVHKIVITISQKLNKLLREQLKPSHIADHKHYLEDEEEILRRAVCTAGTRRRILQDLIAWANAVCDGHSIYWLFGPAGTGKSTIAFTIARRFEFACVPEDTIILGANFFCSRQFEETKTVTKIVPTIVYQLALVCKAFADAYDQHGDDSTIQQNPAAQLRGLLVEPWKQSQAARIANKDPTYLVGIDAVDELKSNGGSVFLRALLNVQGELSGLKFFVTSREDQALVTYSKGLGNGRVCHLREVPREEADADLRTYLEDQLGHVASDEEIQRLVTDAAGLFIYAATVVEHVGATSRPLGAQRDLLNRLLNVSPSTSSTRSRSATATLDKLYLQILKEALNPFDPEKHLFQQRLDILHTFLCTVERTSTSVVTHLLDDSFDNDGFTVVPNTSHAAQHSSVADDVLGRLHAVLYSHGGQVVSFHKSFPDFVFDQQRSKEFYCDQGSHHRRLAEGCFRIMRQQLRFNVANIPDSSIFDRDNTMLEASVKRNISPALSYACRSWSQHALAAPVAYPVALLMHDFLQLQVLFWIETMNLLGQRGRCDAMLREVQKWVASSKEFTNLAKHLRDAAAFAVYFSASPAASSTPHLYLSALATFPQPTDLRAIWRTQFGGIPAFVNAIRGTGGSPLMSMKGKSEVNAVAVSPDGFWIVTGLENGIVQVWELSTGEVLKTLEGHGSYITSVAFSHDGTRIISGSGDEVVRVWDAFIGEEVKTLEGHSGFLNSMAFSPDGTRIVSAHDETVLVWDATSGEELMTLEGHSDDVTSVAFSQDGTRIVSGSADQTVKVWDALSWEELKSLEGHGDDITSVAFSQDGTHIVSGSNDETVRVWNTSSGEVLKVLEGHTDPVTSVAFSPNGTHIASGSEDQTVRLWDASSGEELMTLEGHSDDVTSLAFSQDGTRIVSGSSDETVRVWDALSGEELMNLEGHSDTVTAVAFSQDGTRIASGSDDQTVRVWDVSSKEGLMTLKGHCSYITSVAFSYDGTRIISGSGDEVVQVWDAISGEELKTLGGHSGFLSSMAFSPDGTRIVSAHDETVLVWDATSGEELTTLEGHSDDVTSVAFSQDGTRIVSGSSDETVKVWDALSGDELTNLKGHTDAVTSVAFSYDGRRIVSGSDDQTVRVWDALSGEELVVLNGHGDTIHSVAFSQDGVWIVSGSVDQTVRVWDASSGEELKTLQGHSNYVTSVTLSQDGARIVSGSDDETVRVWDMANENELKVREGHTDRVRSGAFSPDGTYAVSASEDQTVQVWDVLSGEKLRILEGHSGGVNSVAFSPDGMWIVSGSNDQTVRVWDVSSGEELKTLQGHSDSVTSVAVSYDGMWIVSGSDDQTVHVWDASDGKEMRTLEGHSDFVTSVAFSYDGRRIVSGSDDQTVRVWDVSSGKELMTLGSHSGGVSSVAFSQDGMWIVSGSDDETVQVWDASDGEELRTLEGHSDYVTSVAVSPDSMQIISGSSDRTVRVWDALNGEHLMTLEGHTDYVTTVVFSNDGKRIMSGSDDQTLRVWAMSSREQDGMFPAGAPLKRYTREKTPQDDHTGWLVAPNISSAYLMFVPPSENLLGDSILALPRHSVSYVDFSKAKLGTHWAQCYTPVVAK